MVFLLGASEWVIGGLTANNGLDFYLMAWAATTGGLWFLFERAESALSPESRSLVVDRILHPTFARSAASLAAQFALLFDRVFGETPPVNEGEDKRCGCLHMGAHSPQAKSPSALEEWNRDIRSIRVLGRSEWHSRRS